MGLQHGKDTVILVNTIDLSSFCKGSDLDTGADEHDTTVYGQSGHRYRTGLTDGSFSIEGFFDDGASNTPETVLRPLLGDNEGTAIEYRPEGTGSGLSEFSFTGVLTSFQTSAPVDDMVTFTAEFKVSGAVDNTDQV